MRLFEYHKKNMSAKDVTWRFVILVLAIAAASAALAYFVGQQNAINEQIQSLTTEQKIHLVRESDPFTPDKLAEYLDELNVQYTDIVLAQAQLETNMFTSRIFQENNNLFGMKVARVRPTTNQGEQYNHAYYSHWRESVLDYAMYQAKYLSGLSRQEYLQYLGKYYAEDSNYVRKIDYLLK